MKILESLVPLVEALKEAGISTNIDPARLNPPCAWIAPATLTPLTLDGSGDLACDVYLIAPDNGMFETMAALESMLALLLEVVDPDGEIDLAAGVQTSQNSVLPAFKVPVLVTALKAD